MIDLKCQLEGNDEQLIDKNVGNSDFMSIDIDFIKTNNYEPSPREKTRLFLNDLKE
jgi:hypothetical protein